MSGALEVVTLPLGPIGTNCYVAHLAGDDRAIVIDPGADAPTVLATLADRGLRCEAVLVTHCHWDHIGAVGDVARATGAPVYMSSIESFVLADPQPHMPPQMGEVAPYSVDHELDGGEHLQLAGMQLEAIHLPGHSPGTIGFYVEPPEGDPVLFVGDLIFHDSIGRFDLPFADGPTLFASARMLLERLGDEVVLLPGHGQATTIGRERAHNPFLRQLA